MSRSTCIFGSSQAGCPMAKKTDRRMPIGLGMLIAVLGMLFGPLPLAASAAGARPCGDSRHGLVCLGGPLPHRRHPPGSGQPNAGKPIGAIPLSTCRSRGR